MAVEEAPLRDRAPSTIAGYGIIGDGRTAALCSVDGSIDWLCVPRFDSRPIFGRLVDPRAGGSFSIRPERARSARHRYRERSAVLETEWETETGAVRLTEGMVLDVSSTLLPQLLLVRRLSAVGGRTPMMVRFDPRRGLPGSAPRIDRRGSALHCGWGALIAALTTDGGLGIEPGREERFLLDPFRDVTFALSVADRQPVVAVSAEAANAALERTDRWWRDWSDEVSYDGPEREAVIRSLITLRLLTFVPSGAPVAAPTTSLPEVVGGSRNWDYRFAWPRDASLGITSFLSVGKLEEAHSFMHWLLHASRLSRPRVDVLYTLDGRPGPAEEEVPVEGYRNSRPVRVGNGASEQHQLDVYGWVLDATLRLALAQGDHLHGATIRAMAGFADHVAGRWTEPDSGIWEVRGDPQHHVHSKVMAWVTLDRALKLHRDRRVRRSRVAAWTAAKDALASEIPSRGFNDELGTYVRTYGGEDVDASFLTLPGLGFDRDRRDRLSSSVDKIRETLAAAGPLLYRYAPDTDGLEGTEGAFTPCSFWLVDALAALDRAEEAQAVFADACSLSTPLQLFAEEIDPSSREHIGNFPQALTHSALVQAASSLDASLRRASGQRED